MDDRFLESYARDPRAEFAGSLRRRLAESDAAPRRGFAWRPALAGATALATVIALFAFPSVRAFAQSVLDLFRVRSFVAVSFDPERLEKLRAMKQDNTMVVFDRKEVLQDPGKPTIEPSAGAASALVGFNVASPTYLPGGLVADTVAVTGEGRARLGITTSRLRDLLAQLDLRDVEVPANLDGKDLSLHMYPVVSESYRHGERRMQLVQSRSPDIALPSGVDLARLGEMGLRILGLDAGEARRVARSIDWRSTLVVPVPLNASSFRPVTVRGNSGLLVTLAESSYGRRQRAGTVVLWTEGDRVFALDGTLSPPDMMQVAESVR
ncbi:MAG: hypothetical protein HY076_02050 [Candidatus Eisenbacteria bacterium]|uniref:DUF4367 domain-containing protein n=1 Tax=Eiseniibacteriota bacterium TaxID=2212470 RepID=A0A9D6LAH9_UNCEI|nr:hypothetical protein [Candidatus Eisenbacteria bacterium]MBI3539039.1 hypothetical protein [Candidatus Eisenbacteria bacterium]